jgi:hypothetical protein
MTTEFLNTESLAELLGVKAQTVRSALCRHGHYLGLRPVKMPNRFLRWRAADAERLLAGERIEPVSE